MEQRNEAASDHASMLTCSFLFRALARLQPPAVGEKKLLRTILLQVQSGWRVFLNCAIYCGHRPWGVLALRHLLGHQGRIPKKYSDPKFKIAIFFYLQQKNRGICHNRWRNTQLQTITTIDGANHTHTQLQTIVHNRWRNFRIA